MFKPFSHNYLCPPFQALMQCLCVLHTHKHCHSVQDLACHDMSHCLQ